MIHGDGVENIRFQLLHGFCNFHNMMIVYSGNNHRIDLNGKAFCLEQPYRFLLIFDYYPSGIGAPIDMAGQSGPGVYFLGNCRVNRIDCYGDMADLDICQFIHVVR